MTAHPHKNQAYISIEESIRIHPAWYGKIAGLYAEKKLRGQAPYTYLLRDGESSLHYYVTFAHPDGSVGHQPFTISVASDQLYFENGDARGPFEHETILDVVHIIMHCKQEECVPLIELK